VICVDTNLLAYVEGVGPSLADAAKADAARDLLARCDPDLLVIPAQVLGELAHVIRRKSVRGIGGAAEAVARWCGSGVLLPATTPEIIAAAVALAAEHQMQLWDAVILAAAAEARCDWLLSEDLHPGFAFRGCTVIDPFAGPLPPRLARALSPPRPAAI